MPLTPPAYSGLQSSFQSPRQTLEEVSSQFYIVLCCLFAEPGRRKFMICLFNRQKDKQKKRKSKDAKSDRIFTD